MATGTKLAKYKQLLIDLFPLGRLWQIEEQPVLSSLIESLAKELCRVDDRIEDFLREIDPRQTEELLEDWERLLALPDECTPENFSNDERRNQVTQKLTNVGGLSKSYYEFIISKLGFEASVNNDLPFRVGHSVVGDALTNDFDIPFRVGFTVGQPLYNYGWKYYFTVTLPATAVTEFRVGQAVVGDPLRSFSNELVECTIKKLKPAHAGVTFRFI